MRQFSLAALLLVLCVLPVMADSLFTDSSAIEGRELRVEQDADRYLAVFEAYKDALEAMGDGNGNALAAMAHRRFVDLGKGEKVTGDDVAGAVGGIAESLGGFDSTRDMVDMGAIRVLRAESVDALKSDAVATVYRPTEGDLLVTAPSKSDRLPKAVTLLFNKENKLMGVDGLLGAAPAKGQANAGNRKGKKGEGSGGSGGSKGTNKLDIANTHYYVHVPESYSGGPTPVVLHFHGAGSSAEREIMLWQEAADEGGFIAACLKSVGQSYILNEGANAVAVLEDLAKKYNIDESRVYVTGFSAGGVLAIFFCTTTESVRVAGFGIFCSPYGPDRYVWRPRNEAEKAEAEKSMYRMPAYFASNSGDANFPNVKRWVEFFKKRGHKTTFTDESARLSKHTYDRQSCKDAWKWLSQHSLP